MPLTSGERRRAYATRCRHPSGAAMPCDHCHRRTCIDCHHEPYHLRVCEGTRKELRRP